MKMKEIRNRGYELQKPSPGPQGDSALLVRFGDRIDPELNQQVHSLFQVLSEKPIHGFIESIPGYCTLVVSYDPLKASYEDIENWVKKAISKSIKYSPKETKSIEVPMLYGGDYGPDLEDVARIHSIDPNEVIRLHSCVTYRVYFLGFQPGFPYLGPLDSRLETPRLETPRLEVKAGSVGIAGKQTGIYPLDSPGGWRIIGWTPLTLFDPNAEPPARFSPGDTVRFIPLRDGKLLT